ASSLAFAGGGRIRHGFLGHGGGLFGQQLFAGPRRRTRSHCHGERPLGIVHRFRPHHCFIRTPLRCHCACHHQFCRTTHSARTPRLVWPRCEALRDHRIVRCDRHQCPSEAGTPV